MGIVHVSCTLDEDLQICRYISFVELVELLKFGQIHFEHANGFQHSRLLAAAAAWRRSPYPPQANNASTAKQTRLRNQLLRAWPRGNLAFQSWTMLPGTHAVHWNTCSCSEQNIAIVSTANNLADSLLVPDDTTVIIGQDDELALEEVSAAPSPHGLLGNCASRMPSGNIGVIANSAYAPAENPHERGMSLHVVLPTLLSSVIVAPYVTERFFDLVAKLVGENTSATVKRAGQLPFEIPEKTYASRKNRGYLHGPEVRLEHAVPPNILYLSDAKRRVFS